MDCNIDVFIVLDYYFHLVNEKWKSIDSKSLLVESKFGWLMADSVKAHTTENISAMPSP